jgi:hypothetical protein
MHASRAALCLVYTSSSRGVQDDYALGEPDWTEVIECTALDLQQLLPSKHEILDLVARAAGTDTGGEEMQALLKEAEMRRDDSSGGIGSSASSPAAAAAMRKGSSRPQQVDTLRPHDMKGGEEEEGDAEGQIARSRAAIAGKARRRGAAAANDKVMMGVASDSADAAAAEERRANQASRAMQLHNTVASADKLLRLFQVRCRGPRTPAPHKKRERFCMLLLHPAAALSVPPAAMLGRLSRILHCHTIYVLHRSPAQQSRCIPTALRLRIARWAISGLPGCQRSCWRWSDRSRERRRGGARTLATIASAQTSDRATSMRSRLSLLKAS